MRSRELDPPSLLLAGAAIAGLGAIWVSALVPEWFLRPLLRLLTHAFYRIDVLGAENLPETGGALLVSNHLSLIDALLLLAATHRPIRFLLFEEIYQMPLVKPWAILGAAIPLSSAQRPREMIRSLRTASDAIRNGEIVGIFAEGQITRTGQLLPFRRGLERIMKGVDAPVVPVSLDGVWGSIFSFERGRFFWKMPRRLRYPVTVSFGQRLPSSATASEVRGGVQELQAAAFATRRKQIRALDSALVRSAHLHPFRFLMADSLTPGIGFFKALTGSILLARKLKSRWADEKMAGILLPPSVGGALVNYAASLLGRVPVNLTYTSSNEVLASCARQCDLKTVVTSKAFLDRLPGLEIAAEKILLEDLVASAAFADKFLALLIALLPYRLLKRTLGARRSSLDELATVIFSSGSTGDPKGVMLTHSNIASNIHQVLQVFMLGGSDRILGILPFFHAFGFTIALWLPAANGSGIVFHPNPLDARAISELVDRYRVTFLIATPTFLQAYIRRSSPEHFASLKYVLAGAEKLPDRVALAFEDTFGIRPLEGYGCTECAPVVAVNGPDYRAPGFLQVSARRGTIGHPLPGVAVRVVDFESGDVAAEGESGLLMVKGPNVMKGYLDRPEQTAEVLRDGWYMTGDVARIDDDGFITITGRLSRFSKLGGEMVPHGKIEDTLHELADTTEQVFAVTSTSDEKKGERIVVLHTLTSDRLDQVLEKLARSELPPLWKPKPNQFFYTESLPYLGSGKLDLRALKTIATERAQALEVSH